MLRSIVDDMAGDRGDQNKIVSLERRVADLEAALEVAMRPHQKRSNAGADYFHSFMEYSPATAWIKDENGKYVYTNKSHRELCGYEPSYIVGKTDADLFDPDLVPVLRNNDEKVLRSGEPVQTIETGSILNDEETRSWVVCKFPLKDHRDRQLVGGVGLDISEQIKAEDDLHKAIELQQLLFHELDHRVRNNLASLITLIDLSRRSTQTVDEFAASIHSRVQAMSAVHGLLSYKRWDAIDLPQLIHTMVPEDVRHAVRTEGQDVAVISSQGTALGMLIQELVSNSLKYGALSAGGTVQVRWDVEQSPKYWIVTLHWRELDGPPIEQPHPPGVGTRLIKGIAQSDLGGDAVLEYPRDGAAHRFTLRLARSSPDLRKH